MGTNELSGKLNEPVGDTEGGGVVASVAQVFAFNLLSKGFLVLVTLLTIHAMRETEYAQLTFAMSLVTAASQTFAGSFNRVYIAGHCRLGLGQAGPAFLGVQLLGMALAALL